MTLYEALQDQGKGRIIDNGCDYDLIALAKGSYTARFYNGKVFNITLTGKQGENDRKIEKEYNLFCRDNRTCYNEIQSLDYERR